MSQIPVKDVTPEIEIVELYAKREHIYVKFYRGLFKNLRIISSAVMLIAFYGTTWLQWDGRQAVHFDLPGRQFHIFGMTFWPQDFMLLSWLLIILAFLLFFVTVFAGRLWCGYACPQFVWTWLFIWAERIAEGDRNARMKRDQKPMSVNKFARKTLKHSIWILIAIATSIAFVGYFTPIRELIPKVMVLDLGSWEMWWLGFFAIATYGNAGWLREQVCIYMCPYSRFQSVMFDQDTLIISYDEKRGESRGSRKKESDYKAQGLGDCIDCGYCVDVCPVGIDIRDGLQYECVACGACVDACDDIMERMGYEKGLVRYTTEHALEGNETKLIRPRLVGYFVALLAMFFAFSFVLATRIPIELDVIRDRGELYYLTSDGLVRNSYNIKIANKSQQDYTYRLTVSGLDEGRVVGNTEVFARAGELAEKTLHIDVDPRALERPNYSIEFKAEALSDESVVATSESRFIGPTQ